MLPIYFERIFINDRTWRDFFWQELRANWCKHFRTGKHKVMTSPSPIHALQSESSIYQKPSCDVIIICFQDKTIFIFLDCFM